VATTTTKSQSWLPYVAPFFIYMAFLGWETNADRVWLYPAKVIAVAAVLWFFRRDYQELRLNFSLLAVAVGLLVIVLWIALDPYYPKVDDLFLSGKQVVCRIMHWAPPKNRPALPFDPTTINSVVQRNLFIGFRVLGAVVVVPLMEELFWRAFLIRWLVDEDFKKVPVGTFTWVSFAFTVALFGGEHQQWLAGLICGALYNWLLYKRKDVFSCVVAHAVSNAVLAAWVLARGDWKFW
jgi:membrane protease YdiL (CAAX protease family)